MTIGFPTNTALLIILSMGGMAAVLWFTLSQGLEALSVKPEVKRSWRWGAAIFLAAWFVIRVGLALYPPGGAVLGAPYVVGFFSLGMVAGLVPLSISPIFRQIIAVTPITRLVGLQLVRVVGVFFITLLDMKLLPAQFALPAGYGDVAVGILAVWMVFLLDKQKPYARTLVILWNVLGLLDLVTALATGFTFIPAFGSQLAASGISPLYLNYVLIIPTFGVPLAVLLHIYTLFKVLSVRKPAEGSAQPAQTPAFSGEGR